jgi:hypothetical protein
MLGFSVVADFRLSSNKWLENNNQMVGCCSQFIIDEKLLKVASCTPLLDIQSLEDRIFPC